MTEAALVAKVNELLGRVVAHREDIDGKRNELYGLALVRSAQGAYEVTPEALT